MESSLIAPRAHSEDLKDEAPDCRERSVLLAACFIFFVSVLPVDVSIYIFTYIYIVIQICKMYIYIYTRTYVYVCICKSIGIFIYSLKRGSDPGPGAGLALPKRRAEEDGGSQGPFSGLLLRIFFKLPYYGCMVNTMVSELVIQIR